MSTLSEMIKARDVAGLKSYMAQHRLRVDGNKIVPADDASRVSLLAQAEFWNQRQQAR